MKRQNFSIYISVLALFVSSISLWLSYQNREHDRLIAFEQRKQEVRQLIIEGELLFRKLDEELLSRIRTDKTPEQREKAAKSWSEANEAHRAMKSMVSDFDKIGTTSDTPNRIALEGLFTNQQIINKRVRELLDEWVQDPH